MIYLWLARLVIAIHLLAVVALTIGIAALVAGRWNKRVSLVEMTSHEFLGSVANSFDAGLIA
jgi:hypothetical protein